MQGEPRGARTHVERIGVRPKALSAFASWTCTRTALSRSTEQHVTNAKLLSDIPTVDMFAPESESGVAGDIWLTASPKTSPQMSHVFVLETPRCARRRRRAGRRETGDLIGRHRLTMAPRWRSSPSASSGNVSCNRVSSEFCSLQMNSLRNQSRELIRDRPPYQTGTGKWRENDPLAAMKHLARARVSDPRRPQLFVELRPFGFVLPK